MIERFFGVDFSGAESAGAAIWIAEARIHERRAHIESCRSAADLPDSAPARARCLTALVEFVADQHNAVVGCDFPFSLPAALIDAADWRTFALGFAARFVSAEDFLADCRRRAGGREMKRVCDRESKVPFAAYNLRIYRQTYYGIRDFLAPLVRERRAAVVPMEECPKAARPWIIETCPASTLKHAGLYPSYKGKGTSARTARRHIIDGLASRGLVGRLSAKLRRLAIDNAGGDALDSIVAAAATVRAYATGQLARQSADPNEGIEGRVYF